MEKRNQIKWVVIDFHLPCLMVSSSHHVLIKIRHALKLSKRANPEIPTPAHSLYS